MVVILSIQAKRMMITLYTMTTVSPGRVDHLDAALIELLAAEPRVGVLEASRRLRVARGTVQARLERLQERGVITGYGPEVDPAALGYEVTAFVTLWAFYMFDIGAMAESQMVQPGARWAWMRPALVQMKIPMAPSGTIPSSTRPPDQTPARTLPTPIPTTSASIKGPMSASVRWSTVSP